MVEMMEVGVSVVTVQRTGSSEANCLERCDKLSETHGKECLRFCERE